MFSQFLHNMFGSGEYLKYSDLEKMTRRDPFSSFLNYLAYDPNLEIYLNQDESLGMLWECVPVIYAGPKTITALEGLFRAGLPKDSVIQLIFHVDSHIEPTLERYRASRTRKAPIVISNTDEVIEFLSKGKNIENLERDFTAPVPSITPLLPVQADFAGSGADPKLIFTGRKGQLVSLNLQTLIRQIKKG